MSGIKFISLPADIKQYEKYMRIFGTKKSGGSIEGFREIKYNKAEKWETIKARKQDAINNLS